MNKPDPQKRDRAPFECQRCNQCCHGRGGIIYQPEEIPAAAAMLDMDPAEFISAFLAPKDGGYEVLCNQNGACRLLGPDGCRVHQAKPAICRRWPFFPGILANPSAFEDARQACPGIDPDISHEAFVAHAHQLGYSEDDAS